MLHAVALAVGLTFASADGSSIAGTLSFPVASRAAVPAIVLVGTNGPADRTEPVGATPLFDLYAQAFNAAGFAVLRYDTRGIGESTTKTEAHAVRRQNFVDDAAAAVRALIADPRIDASRVYVLGVSEGGETALAVALQGVPVRGLVLVGPLSVPYAQALAQQDRGAPPPVLEHDALLLAEPYFQSYQAIDPRKEIAFVRQPILALRGFADTQTLPIDFDQLVQAAKDTRREITVRRFSGDDHFLLELSDDELHTGPQYQRRHEFDPAAAAAIVTWLRSH
ncbi:MAG TPA: alpha/beta fold hydrolase [Candidatus Rubrimentiphilum sp.]|nr:alpha/beta fold hydrolase [Candidatus Rubrimentiphilum sp.]